RALEAGGELLQRLSEACDAAELALAGRAARHGRGGNLPDHLAVGRAQRARAVLARRELRRVRRVELLGMREQLADRSQLRARRVLEHLAWPAVDAGVEALVALGHRPVGRRR